MFESIELLNVLKSKGYSIFTQGTYNVNIIGVRSSSIIPNLFNDTMHLIYMDEDNSILHKQYKITTDAGLYWLENPSRVEGTAILVPNQYRGSYEIGLHRGRYSALCQRKPVQVYRDGNKDNRHDFEPHTIMTGFFGINIHRANSTRESTRVDKWSAGCQVFANPEEYREFMYIIRKSASMYGNSFTYTLITEEDINKYRRDNE